MLPHRAPAGRPCFPARSGWRDGSGSCRRARSTAARLRRAGCLKTCGTVSPAMPLPASIAILNGLIFARSTNERQCAANSSSTLRCEIVPARCGLGGQLPAKQMRRGSSPSPVSSEIACACARVNFMPLYCGGIMRCRDHDAAVERVLSDREIERVGRNHADVDHVGAGFGRAAGEGFEELFARGAHVAPDCNHRPRPQSELRRSNGTKQRPMP